MFTVLHGVHLVVVLRLVTLGHDLLTLFAPIVLSHAAQLVHTMTRFIDLLAANLALLLRFFSFLRNVHFYSSDFLVNVSKIYIDVFS